MKRSVKKYKDFITENTEVAPLVKPKTTPKTRPGRPSPIKRDQPSVNPKPKATAEEL